MATTRWIAGAIVGVLLVIVKATCCDFWPIVNASGIGAEAVATAISAVGITDPSIVFEPILPVPQSKEQGCGLGQATFCPLQ